MHQKLSPGRSLQLSLITIQMQCNVQQYLSISQTANIVLVIDAPWPARELIAVFRVPRMFRILLYEK